MNFLRELVKKINSNVITRNLVLAVCAILVFVVAANILLNLFTRHGQIRKVPDFSGMTVDEAKHAGRHASLKIEINDSLYVPVYEGGIILEQNPKPGAEVKSGRRIFVTVNSFKQKTVVIPYVTGFSLRQAKTNLDIAGLGIEKLIYKSDIATNNVLEERYDGKVIGPGNKLEAEVGSGVTLVVGLAEDATPQAIPMVVGFSLHEAKSRLWEIGFNVGKVTMDEGINPLNEREATVYMQSPGPGTRMALGTSVNFAITLDESKLEKGVKAADKEARAAAAAYESELKESEESNKN